MVVEVRPSGIDGTVEAPASKSYAQRAVAAALLAAGESTLTGMSLCNDTSAALDAAQRLGADIHAAGRTYTIKGGLDPRSDTIDIGESGLSARLFTPVASLCGGQITITGHGSILSRSIASMEPPLRELGVEAVSAGGFLPLAVKGPAKGGEAHVDGSAGSQFLTGLLMALPLAEKDTALHVDRLASRPYIDMTLEVLKAFGIEADHKDHREFFIKGGQRYTPCTYSVEGDWSGASCLLVAGAVAGSVVVKNLNVLSLQADVEMLSALERAGAVITTTGGSVAVSRGEGLRAFEFDATDCPDLFPALVALAANCEGVSVITGTGRLANKESDRARTLAGEFGRLGVAVDISQHNVMKVTGGPIGGGEVSSHNDHRIAMAAAVAGLNAASPVTIHGAEAVDKSYPAFWDDFKSLTV